ncbi:MAG: nicotinate-nucleotide adenylyltransferase [Pseudomonadota bacterium]
MPHRAAHPGAFSEAAALLEPLKMPAATVGQRIGLFGGSFNPPHRGHRLLALTSLSRLALDRVWWMVTPGNPLKSSDDLAPLTTRVEAAQGFADHPKMAVTAFEAAIGVRYSADAIRYALRRYPGVRFVFLMGADNLAALHRWQKWHDIMRLVPVAVINRPGASMAALSSPAARAFARYRRPEAEAAALAGQAPPAWVFLHGPLNPLSSTVLRSQTRGFRGGMDCTTSDQ